MEKLNLPIIQQVQLGTKRLSMDDYLKFVYFNLKYTFNKKANKKWKRLLAVNTQFSL